MIYFYIWALIVLGSTVAVPILAFMEKSKQRKLMEANALAPPPEAPTMDDVAMPMAQDTQTPFGQDELGTFPSTSGENLSAFEEFQ